MSTVQYLNHVVDRQLVQKMFLKFASKYGNLWTSRLGEHGDWKACEDDWLEELSAFTLRDAINGIKKSLAIYKNYPPTQGQVIELCMAESGVPSVADVIRLMVSRDFSHPLVKMVYDKIGGWTLTNGKESEIQNKAKAAYDLCVADFQIDPQSQWEKLTCFNNQPKLEAPPPKIPSAEERKGFKERMAEYQQKLEDQKLSCKGKTYREFDEKKIKPGGREFDQATFDEFKAYLLSIPDSETMILPIEYIYQRMRFMGERDQSEYLKKSGYVPLKDRESVSSPKTSDKKGPTRIYKSWGGD